MKLVESLRVFHDAMVGKASTSDAALAIREDGIDRELRIRVYANAYLSRIGGVLEEHYPRLRALVGDAAFRPLIRDYLRAYPPGNFSLREAGAELARFLFDTTKNFLHVDLARLERARLEAFDGPDGAVLTREAVAALPPEEFPGLRLVLVPTAKLLILTTNADDVWDDICNSRRARTADERPAPPSAEVRRSVLVWRRDITVIHRTLEDDEASALHQLQRGSTFATICNAFSQHADPGARAIELLLRWIDAEILAAS